MTTASSIYDFKVIDIANNGLDLHKLRDKALLIVNTASKCGFTSQYAELEQLYKIYHEQGLEILAFPCNQFKNQESGTHKDIYEFCSLTYAVTFPLMAKIEVNGENAHPLYSYLKNKAPGFLGTKSIKWNFTKFLIGKNESSVTRFSPMTKPSKLEHYIQSLLSS